MIGPEGIPVSLVRLKKEGIHIQNLVVSGGRPTADNMKLLEFAIITSRLKSIVNLVFHEAHEVSSGVAENIILQLPLLKVVTINNCFGFDTQAIVDLRLSPVYELYDAAGSFTQRLCDVKIKFVGPLAIYKFDHRSRGTMYRTAELFISTFIRAMRSLRNDTLCADLLSAQRAQILLGEMMDPNEVFLEDLRHHIELLGYPSNYIMHLMVYINSLPQKRDAINTEDLDATGFDSDSDNSSEDVQDSFWKTFPPGTEATTNTAARTLGLNARVPGSGFSGSGKEARLKAWVCRDCEEINPGTLLTKAMCEPDAKYNLPQVIGICHVCKFQGELPYKRIEKLQHALDEFLEKRAPRFPGKATDFEVWDFNDPNEEILDIISWLSDVGSLRLYGFCAIT